jgi:site-specific recombinase XerD
MIPTGEERSGEENPVEVWLGRIQGSRVSYSSRMDQFIRWLRTQDGSKFRDATPQELVDYQEAAQGKARFDILRTIERYVTEMNGRTSSKKTALAVLRSFFIHNLAELPKDPSFNISSDTPPVNGELKPEQIKAMLARSNVTYRAILLSIFQGALDLTCWEYWNLNGWLELKEQLDRGEQIIKISLPGRKKHRNETPFYTLIGADAVEMIKAYLAEGHRPEGATAIFYNKNGEPMTKHALDLYWLRALSKEKMITRKVGGGSGDRASRYGKNLHEMRDTFRTLWTKTTANKDVAEFLMGHEVDKLGYNKAMQDVDWVKEEYKAALPMLQIWSEVAPLGYADRDEVRRIKAELELEKLKRMERDLDLDELKTAYRASTQTSKELAEVVKAMEKRLNELENKKD